MAQEPQDKQLAIIPPETIERKIYLIRGQKVMLDRDLAALYRVETRALIQAVTRNPARFPEDFMFRLSNAELKNWRSQIVMSNPALKMGLRRPPYAFTELGVAMLSSVLRSERAVQMNVLIMRAFVRLREILATHRDLAEKMERLEGQQNVHASHIANLYELVKRLAAEKRKRRNPIGFISETGTGRK